MFVYDWLITSQLMSGNTTSRLHSLHPTASTKRSRYRSGYTPHTKAWSIYLRHGVGAVTQGRSCLAWRGDLGLRGGGVLERLGVDGHALGDIVGLVDTHEAVCDLEHVVSQADDDELGVLGAFLIEAKRE